MTHIKKMSASVVLVDVGEDLEGRQQGGVLLHQIIVQLDVGLVLHYGALSIQLLTVLGDEPQQGIFHFNSESFQFMYLWSSNLFPLSSILSSLDR